MGVLELNLVAEPSAVRTARTRVLAALAEEPLDHEAVALAVTEAVANAVMHAYRFHDAPGYVSIAVERRDHAVEVSVCDEGIGLAPRPDSPGAGLGIPLMTSLADHIDIDTTAGTRVRLRFALQPDPAPVAVPSRRFARTGAPQSLAA